MKQPVLKKMLQNERHMNLMFNKGWRHTLVMVLIYTAVRFSDPIVAIACGKPVELEFNLIVELLVPVCIGWVAMLGNVKLAGLLCLLTPAGNAMMIASAAKTYSGGFVEMLHRAPMTWYILAMSVICGAVGIALLIDSAAAAFGKRRKEIQKEYAAAVKAWANEARHKDEVHSEHQEPELVKPPEKQAAVQVQEPIRCIPLQEEAIQKAAVETLAKESVVEKEPEEDLRKAKDDSRQQAIAEHMAELEKETLTLRASSIPNAVSKVGKQRFFDLYREMVCKEFGCCEEEVDSATYILVFPGDRLVRMKWLPEEKKIRLESNTKRYGAQFHALMLDVVSYLSKTMGVKFDITDIDEHSL